MKGPALASMAWRNLWRNRRRTLITLSAIAFGTMLAILFTGISDSTYGDMIDLAARLGSGHVTIQHPEYFDKPALTRSVSGIASLRKAALAQKEVTKTAVRVTGQLMLSTARGSYGAGFAAIDPAEEDLDTFALLESIAPETLFEKSRDRGILLGSTLAHNLGAKPGNKVIYTMTDKRGEIITGLARVRGLIESGIPGLDRGLCLLPLDTVRDLLGYSSDEATMVAVYIRDRRSASAVAARLGDSLPDVAVLPWFVTQPDLAGFISMKVTGSRFFETVVMILVAAGIFNTLLMSVMERRRELGIMTAIGFSPTTLFRLVMWESLWLALCGLVAAALVTAGPYYLGATKGIDLTSTFAAGGEQTEIAGVALAPVMYTRILPENLAVIVVLALVATLLSGVYPAWRAGRVDPVETIKLE